MLYTVMQFPPALGCINDALRLFQNLNVSARDKLRQSVIVKPGVLADFDGLLLVKPPLQDAVAQQKRVMDGVVYNIARPRIGEQDVVQVVAGLRGAVFVALCYGLRLDNLVSAEKSA